MIYLDFVVLSNIDCDWSQAFDEYRYNKFVKQQIKEIESEDDLY